MSSTNALRQPPRWEPLLSTAADRMAALGVVGLRCRLVLHLEVSVGRLPVAVSFVVDSGASYSLISLEFAELRRVPVPPPGSEVDVPMRTAQGMTPVRVRPGRVQAWWGGERQGYLFDWPVLYRIDAPVGVPSILGLGGVVRTCRWTFDGTYAPESPYGFLTLEDIR